MHEYIRFKKRNSGKTTDLVMFVKNLLKLNRNILILTPGIHCEKELKSIIRSRNLNFPIVFGTINNLSSTFRGRRFDTIVIDEWDLFSSKDQEMIMMQAHLNSAIVVMTSTI